MSDPREEFSLRVRRLNSKRRTTLKSNSSILLDADGYVIVRGQKTRRGFPLRGLMVLTIAFFGIKGAMMAQLGPVQYEAKLQALNPTESKVAAVGVWTMRPDPVSNYVAEQIQELL